MLNLLKKEYIDDEVFTRANARYTYFLTKNTQPAAASTKPAASNDKSQSATSSTASTVGKVAAGAAAVVAATATAAVEKVKEVAAPEKSTFHLDVSDSDDDFNLSDDDEDDGGAAALIKKRNEEALAKVLAKEKNKPKARSSIIWDIKPEDDTTDMDAVEKSVRAIKLPSVEWQGSDRVPVAYGIMKLRIISQIVDDDIATDDIQEAIEGIEGVQSSDIYAFNKV